MKGLNVAPKQRKHPVCCAICGSDTTNISKICVRCFSGESGASHAAPREELDMRDLLHGIEITRDDEIARDVERSLEID